MTRDEIPLTPSRDMEPIAHCDVQWAQTELKASDAWRKGPRASLALISTTALRVVLMGLRAGAGLSAHRADGAITVHVLEGCIIFRALGQAEALGKGHLLTLEGGIAHAVDSSEDSVFLLTVFLEKK